MTTVSDYYQLEVKIRQLEQEIKRLKEESKS